MQNNKVNNWSIEVSSYKLETCFIKGTKNALAYCFVKTCRQKLTDHDYEPKGQEFGCTIYEDLPPIINNDTITKINTIEHTLDRPNLKELQTKDAYCRHIQQSLHIPSVKIHSNLTMALFTDRYRKVIKALRH